MKISELKVEQDLIGYFIALKKIQRYCNRIQKRHQRSKLYTAIAVELT